MVCGQHENYGKVIIYQIIFQLSRIKSLSQIFALSFCGIRYSSCITVTAKPCEENDTYIEQSLQVAFGY